MASGTALFRQHVLDANLDPPRHVNHEPCKLPKEDQVLESSGLTNIEECLDLGGVLQHPPRRCAVGSFIAVADGPRGDDLRHGVGGLRVRLGLQAVAAPGPFSGLIIAIAVLTPA